MTGRAGMGGRCPTPVGKQRWPEEQVRLLFWPSLFSFPARLGADYTRMSACNGLHEGLRRLLLLYLGKRLPDIWSLEGLA